MANKCMCYRVSGKVQGVWFRDSTVTRANEIGITGWVRNVPDGSVEVLACGEEVKLEEFFQWLHKGPMLARVDSVQSEQVELEQYTDFSVRYD